jgi:hypothetical protein
LTVFYQPAFFSMAVLAADTAEKSLKVLQSQALLVCCS